MLSNDRLLSRLLSKATLSPNGCWTWVGGAWVRKYGQLWVNGRMALAHRIGYQLLRGEIPRELELDHLCLNHSCINPFHLEPVTHRVNIQRYAATKDRSLCRHGHSMVDAYDAGGSKTGKRCRTCVRIRYIQTRTVSNPKVFL